MTHGEANTSETKHVTCPQHLALQPRERTLTVSASRCCSKKAEKSHSLSLGPAILRPSQASPPPEGEMGEAADTAPMCGLIEGLMSIIGLLPYALLP